MIRILAILLVLPMSIFAQKSAVRTDAIQKTGQPSDRKVEINYDESKVPAYTLPSLLTTSNGVKY